MSWNELPPSEWLETEEQVVNAASYLAERAPHTGLGFDTETTGKDIVLDFPLMASMSDGVRRFAFWANPWLYHPSIREGLLLNPNISKILSNGKFDRHMCANMGVQMIGPFEDTTVLDWLFNENRQGRHGLKEICLDYLGLKMKSFAEVFNPRPAKPGRKPSKKNPLGTPGVPAETAGEAIRRTMNDPEGRKAAIEYSGLDALGAVWSRNALRDRLMEIHHFPGTNLYEYFLNFEVPFTEVLWRMERRGFTIWTGHLYSQLGPIEAAIQEELSALAVLVGEPINPNSPKQLSALFYDRLGMPVTKKTDSGAASTDEDVLSQWVNTRDPRCWQIAEKVLKVRGLSKMKSTYIEGLITGAEKDAFYRIHGTFNQHGTVTGRISSKEPNLQNIPRPKTDKFKIRRAFVAAPGKTLVVADYDQLEMKLMAHFSGDERMISAINNGQDLHCFTVSLMFGIPYDLIYAAKKAKKPTPEQEELLLKRQAAKSVGFGLIYGIGARKLGHQLTEETNNLVTTQEAAGLIKKYFDAFPGVKLFIDSTHTSCRRTEYVQTLLGRYRRLPEINSRGDGDEGAAAMAARQSVNTIIQGTAGDVAKVAMIIAEQDPEMNALGAQLLLQIHDELIWECDDQPDVIARVKTRAQDIMEHPFEPYPFRVKLTCEAKSAYTWESAK